MKYKVLRDNYGFKGGYWSKDQIVTFADHETPPEHFQRIKENVSADVVVPEEGPATFSEINKQKELNKPKTGMGYEKTSSSSIGTPTKK